MRLGLWPNRIIIIIIIIIIISNNNFITYNAQICILDVHVYYQMRVEKMNTRVNACKTIVY